MLNDVELKELLFRILRDNIYCEDDNLFIRNELKYMFHNLLQTLDPAEMQRVYDEIEYKEDDDE